ncbi:hypothetical protein UMM65_06685 [Aureibaculum sp. 2210JD6-5]|nr:hypothetical protein [Aureibaculum sp. 2210JD6-5]MDY7394920.1 hypothetical protein [Aureibaculum sp. 2210JD6-5]
MKIVILILVFIVSFGIAFMNYKNKKKSKEIRDKMKRKSDEAKNKKSKNR